MKIKVEYDLGVTPNGSRCRKCIHRIYRRGRDAYACKVFFHTFKEGVRDTSRLKQCRDAEVKE